MSDFVIQADLDSLRRMLGCEEPAIPAIVLNEYRLRLRMFHSDGNSGPLGTLGLIDLLRSLQYGPKPTAEPPRQIDWSRMPTDGSLRVEVRVAVPAAPAKSGVSEQRVEWRAGVYQGRVGVGSLAIRLDGDKWIHEFRAADVRLPVAKRADRSSADMPVVRTVGDPPAAVEEPKPKRQAVKPVLSNPPGANPLDRAKVGDEVWVQDGEDGEDMKDGSFQGRDHGDILVLVKGEAEPRKFPAATVIYAQTDPTQKELATC